MVDIKALELELAQARQARLDALAASSDVEDMIVEVQHLDSRPPRLAFFISGLDETPASGGSEPSRRDH